MGIRNFLSQFSPLSEARTNRENLRLPSISPKGKVSIVQEKGECFMIEQHLKIPTYSRYMYLNGWSPQEIYASGKQHCYELSQLEKDVPRAIDVIIEKALDDVVKGLQ